MNYAPIEITVAHRCVECGTLAVDRLAGPLPQEYPATMPSITIQQPPHGWWRSADGAIHGNRHEERRIVTGGVKEAYESLKSVNGGKAH